MNKDDSEKDSDCPESPPDSMETQEVVLARENLVSLMAEQKRIRKQKASLPVSVSSSGQKTWKLFHLHVQPTVYIYS